MNDILLDNGNDLDFENGDFRIGDAVYQETKAILENPPGSFKLNGYLGIDLLNELNDDNGLLIKAELKKQLKLDGKRLKSFRIINGIIQADVEYL